MAVEINQSPVKYGTRSGSNSRPLDLQSDSHLLPDTLSNALRDPVGYLCFFFFFIRLSYPLMTCWKRADLSVLLYVMFSGVFVVFSCDISGQVWYLIVSIPDLCLLYL